MKQKKFNHGTFYCGDARTLIKEIPNNSIDLVLSDPPYGLGFGPFDKSEHFYQLESELYRVTQKNAWLVFFWSVKKIGEPFARLQHFTYVWQIIVEHFASFTKSPLGDRRYLSVLVFSKGKPKLAWKGPDIMMSSELPVVDTLGVPLFKSTGVIAQLLTRFARKDGLILDPFAGLGTIPFVCELFGYPWVAFEIFEDWFQLGCSFIEEGRISLKRASLKGRLQPFQLKMDV